ncbi:MotA/TolQ/ExbB proton channel family protein [Leucothrix arctica]|uniref:MotA/TolQ/ExbB proton channel domain-containing protein n=1 Tax=Leucothrix arctica TaxID=1481894 RepID=A0A317CHH0_9GAMM|nr:MotA/TolQ/ExbB proton channel family protein [Leucothrix arctica]PWQ98004.1 hypothetical protein DKT75_05180 [Leucothrix arctica]
MNISTNTARSTLFQIILFLVLLAAALFWQKDNIASLYLSGEINPIGWLLNGVIILLFLLGMGRITSLLLSYSREHAVLERLINAITDGANDPIGRLPEGALAVHRYQYVQAMARKNTPVNHGALASNLSTSEQSRFTLVRYVNSILILLGVFGTVVSLSIALIGASSLLDSPEGANKMGMIIGGMSSALSTTMTAIVCFVIYAYFYLRLNNARAQLLNGIESMTSTHLLPSITHSEESMIRHVAELTIALNASAERLNEMQQHMMDAATQLTNAVSMQTNGGGVTEESMQEMKDLLREGFRLPKAPLKPNTPPALGDSSMPNSTGFQR